MTPYIVEDDCTLPTSVANGTVVTNRNAVGPITVTIPSDSVYGDRFEIHSVESGETLTVTFPSAHVYLQSESLQVTSIDLQGGGTLIAVKTKPAVWTGTLSGSYTLHT